MDDGTHGEGGDVSFGTVTCLCGPDPFAWLRGGAWGTFPLDLLWWIRY